MFLTLARTRSRIRNCPHQHHYTLQSEIHTNTHTHPHPADAHTPPLIREINEQCDVNTEHPLELIPIHTGTDLNEGSRSRMNLNKNDKAMHKQMIKHGTDGCTPLKT